MEPFRGAGRWSWKAGPKVISGAAPGNSPGLNALAGQAGSKYVQLYAQQLTGT
jgi:hypothetical protein